MTLNKSYLHILCALGLLLSSLNAFCIDLPDFLENKIYSENIKTVQMYRDGWKLSNPIITLNSEEQLVFTFDDLTNQQANYYYTIYHCDRNWHLSKLTQQDYLPTYVDFPITDSEFSVNTTVKYVNYFLRIPNEDVPIKYSGNYVLVVYNQDQPNEPIITWRFYVVEPRVKITASIRRATFDATKGENQEVDLMIDHRGYNIQDPASDVKVVISQNNRTDNAIANLKPLFYGNGKLEYNYDMENVFKGANEFRAFEIRGIKYPGEGVADVGYFEPMYHATLLTDEKRTQKRYIFNQDLNGNFLIEAYNKNYPETEADYQMVHFTLDLDQPFLGGGVYVFGKLTNWQCNAENKMVWNFERNQYELSLLLKQGYYNYMYGYVAGAESIVKCENIEGSHYETENEYQIFVYHGRIIDRYDRLIGYQKFNSQTDRALIP